MKIRRACSISRFLMRLDSIDFQLKVPNLRYLLGSFELLKVLIFENRAGDLLMSIFFLV